MTELPRYIGRHASADDAGQPLNDSASADGGYDTGDSASDDPAEEPSNMARDDDEPPSMPEWWQGSQEPPLARTTPWTRPASVGPAPPPEPATPEPESDEPEQASDELDLEPAESEPRQPETAESELIEPDPVESETAGPAPLTPGPVPAPSLSPSPFEPARVSQPAPDIEPEPMPAPVPEPVSETDAEPEPTPEPEPELETVPRFRLSMAPRPRSELPSDEPPGDEPEADLGLERTAVPYSQALPEREAEPQVYSLPEQPYSDEPPKSGFSPRAAEPPGTDSHGLARLARLDAIGAIWPGGTPDLTTWLADNLGLLEDPLGFGLSSQQHFAWMPFQTAVRGLGGDIAPLDIPGNLVTSDLSGAAVMLRAQVEPADTDGLGALLAAASVAQAQTAVWVCPRIDEDMRRTLRWIGGDPSANVRLYGLEMYLVQIGDSPTAPLFDAVVSPGSP